MGIGDYKMIDPDDVVLLHCSRCNNSYCVMCGESECPECGEIGEIDGEETQFDDVSCSLLESIK